VKANRGAAGVDQQSLEEFAENLRGNLYKIWNRMSSGTYFPPPVRTVMIPKAQGGERPLGIPTVADRIAQTVVKMALEPLVEPSFHQDSYAYRPGKSALDAVSTARRRCWETSWVLDLDVRGFFDNLDHQLVLKAVRHYTDCRWILLYVERWLKAPAQQPDGRLVVRDKGSPQGGVISPLLANLFMHFAFDKWMDRTHPGVAFERYADDVIVHCVSEARANELLDSIARRLGECRLELHPEKTKIVYCKDAHRCGRYAQEKFDFLGYTFRPRLVRTQRGDYFVSFSPGVSRQAATAMRQQMRRWRLHRRTQDSVDEIARAINPIIRGWIQYYGRFCKSALRPVFDHLNRYLRWWAAKKYKRTRGRNGRANQWLGRLVRRDPNMFAHWPALHLWPSMAG
jgi:group II intron reverse transcriptase/maturase